MGNYLSQATLKERFDSERELSYLTGDEDTGVVESNDLDDAIEWAEGEMDVRLAVRYATPVSSSEASVTAFLKRMAADLAEYHLIARKPPVTDTTQAKYDQTIATLDKIAEGELVLPGASTASSTGSRAPRLSWSSSNRTLASNAARLFTRETTSRL